MEKSLEIKKADHIQDIAYMGLSCLSLLLAPVYNTWSLCIPILLICLSVYYFTRLTMPLSDLYQYVGSGVYGVFTALLIYQMHGLKEMHFVAFIGSLLLIVYKNWKLQLPLTLVVVVHHSTFAYLEYLGYKEVYFTDSGTYMDFQTFVIHVFLAAVIFFLSGFWSYIFEKNEKHLLKITQSLMEKEKLASKNLEIAKLMANGNLDVSIETSQNDWMGEALQVLQTNLKAARTKEEQEKYTNVGIAEISSILRNVNQNIAQLCDQSLRFLVKYTQANQGAIFVISKLDGREVLQLEACYAYNRKKYLQKHIELGEGLLGQTFLEKETTYLLEVPQNYTHITSGLGEATPTCLILIPLIYNEQAYGVMELAYFTKLDNHVITFLTKAAENIASAIVAAKNSLHTQNLLELATKQREELKNQEEELRQNLEEMQAAQEELHRKNMEILRASFKTQSLINGLKTDMAYVEFDTQKNLVDANEVFLNIMKIPDMNTARTLNHRLFITNDVSDIEYEQFWNTLLTGKPFSGLIKQKNFANEIIWLNAIYCPILDENQQVISIQKFATDFTTIVKDKEQLAHNVKIITEREKIFAFTTILSEADEYGTITYANEKLIKVSKYSFDEMLGKGHNLFRHPDMPKELFKLMWQTIKSGKVFSGIIKNKAKDGSVYWVDAKIIPITDQNGKIIKYIGARYHIEDNELALVMYNKQAERLGLPELQA